MIQKTLIKITLALLAIFIAPCALTAEEPPLHYSRGFTDTRGGLDGRIIVVDTLEHEGPGSIREAIDAEGPRTVVFEVGGVIDLEGETLEITQPHLSIAGQTAPSPGITFIRGEIYVDTHDVIIQHIRIRVGDAKKEIEKWEPDNIATSRTARDVVFDHISAAWSIDENMSVSGMFDGMLEKSEEKPSHRATLSNNLLAEGLKHSTHPKDEHSCGTLIMDNTEDIAVFGNFYAHNFRRNPLLKGNTKAVVVNNLIYNPGRQIIGLEGGNSHSAIVGNYIVDGVDTTNRWKFTIPWKPELFIRDNWRKHEGELKEVRPRPNQTLEEPTVWPERLTAMPAEAAREYVLANVGARPADRDEIDKRILQTLLDGTGKIINSQDEVGGYPEVKEPVRRPLTLPDNGQSIEDWLAPFTREVEGPQAER
ncbi:MAG: polysaccharide lyase family 1 protein [Opitutales bacterium]